LQGSEIVKEKDTVKRTSTALSGIAVLSIAMIAMAQSTPPAGSDKGASTGPKPQRIVIVNIAQVLKEYNKANAQGAEITKLREQYVNKVTGLRTQLKDINDQYQKAAAPEAKTKLENQAKQIQRQIEDIDLEAQKTLTSKSNEVIVSVYKEIKGVIEAIAKANDLDMVLCYPAATDTKMEESPAVAQLMLQTPALIPFYHKGVDVTTYVVQTLNKRYPAPAVPGGTGLPDPKSVSPISGQGGSVPMR
jgi:Skp family chaperone for outer membrane proteins